MQDILQLCISPNRRYYAYYLIKEIDEKICINNLENETIDSFESETVIFLKFLNNKEIIYQTEKKLIIYNFINKKIEYKFLLKYKISDVLFYSNTNLVYSTYLLPDKITVKKLNLEKLTEKFLGEIQISKEIKKKCVDKKYENIFDIFINKLKTNKEEICDEYKNNKVICKYNYLESKIEIDNYIIKEKGNVKRIYILKNLNIVYLLYSFENNTNIGIVNFKNKEKKYLYNIGKNKKLDIQHYNITKRKIPAYILKTLPENEIKYTIIYLHGGPAANFEPYYNYWINKVLNNNIEAILLNYSGSTGYTEKYYKKLFKNNAEEAFLDVKEVIKNKKNVIVIGESFGGYLGILCSFLDYDNIKKIISINGFSDYRYLYLFSVSKYIIQTYFDLKSSKNNPIDMLDRFKINQNLVLINSVEDLYCPIKNINNFIKKSKSSKIKFIELLNYKHYSYSIKLNQKELWKKIIFEI